MQKLVKLQLQIPLLQLPFYATVSARNYDIVDRL